MKEFDTFNDTLCWLPFLLLLLHSGIWKSYGEKDQKGCQGMRKKTKVALAVSDPSFDFFFAK